MLKVLLVDDEKIVLQGVQHILKGQSDYCEVIGTADSGLKGLSLIDELNPDVVITDIKMPDISGLELLKAAKEKHPDLYVIMLSGHAEFDMAREALQYGAYDYLLKPCKHQKISELLRKIHEEVKEDALVKNEYSKMREELTQSKKALEEVKVKEILLNINGNNMDVEHLDGTLMVIENGQVKKAWSNRCEKAYSSFVMALEKDFMCQSLTIKHQKILIIYNCFDLNMIKEKLYQLKMTLNRHGCLIIGAISALKGGREDLSKAYSDCTSTIDYFRFNEVYHVTISKDSFESTDLEGLNHLFDEEKIFRSLFKGDCEYIKDSTKKLFNQLLEGKLRYDHTLTKTKMIQLMVLIEMRLNSNNMDLHQVFDKRINYIYDIEKTKTIRQLFDYVGNVLFVIASYIERSNCHIPPSIRQAMDYIETHFDQDISMNEVAESVYLNPWYFSELFKEKTGITFTDFLTNVRLENAKKLLRTSNLKNFEIAEKVGFENASYFNAVFKKKVGLTPRTYRQMI